MESRLNLRDQKKDPSRKRGLNASWRRHIFPHRYQCSIVCVEAFHFRVRNGNGWFHLAIVTWKLNYYNIRFSGLQYRIAISPALIC